MGFFVIQRFVAQNMFILMAFFFLLCYMKVCDLYCGGGVDIEKWESAQIANYIGIGIFFFLLFSFNGVFSLVISLISFAILCNLL